MANSKHAHFRYNILDECFRKRSYSFDELLDVLNRRIENRYQNENISIRTLREDLKVFRDNKNGFGAPLPEKARILKYSDPNFSIAQRPLLEYEQYLIDASQQLLERFENHPKYDKLAETLIKFQDEEEQEANNLKKILYYDHNEEYKGIKFLKPLYLTIKKKQVIQVTYKGFQDTEASVYEFHPQILKQYNKRWFVFGLNNTRNIKEWSTPLDERLLGFEVLEDIEYIETDTDWAGFFRSMVGVVRPFNSVTVRVVLRFHNDRADFFKTKPFLPDYEEFIEEDKKDQVWFDTIINRELVQQLMSFGQDVEVLEPESLITKMKEHSDGLFGYYNT